MDVMTEHGDLHSAEFAAWKDADGIVRANLCPNGDECICFDARKAKGWIPLYALNPGKRKALFTPCGTPVTPENVHVITTLAPAAQPHAVEGG